MSKKVSPIPRGFRTVTPSLVVSDVDAAVNYYQSALSAEIVNDAFDDSQNYRVFATIKIGNSLVIVTLENPQLGLLSPLSGARTTSQIHLYVENVDDTWSAVIETGGVAISEPAETLWGDRTGLFMDPFGHSWSLASRVESVSKTELAKRVEAARGQSVEAQPVPESADLPA